MNNNEKHNRLKKASCQTSIKDSDGVIQQMNSNCRINKLFQKYMNMKQVWHESAHTNLLLWYLDRKQFCSVIIVLINLFLISREKKKLLHFFFQLCIKYCKPITILRFQSKHCLRIWLEPYLSQYCNLNRILKLDLILLVIRCKDSWRSV